GIHEFLISDKNCPHATHPISVNLPAGFHVDVPTNIASNSPVCAGDLLWLHATATQGATIQWSNPEWGYTSTDSLSEINPCTSNMQGTYFVQQEINGCRSSKIEVPVRVIENPVLVSIDTLCFGESEGGEMHINATGNSQDTLEYALNDGPFQASNVFDHVSNGRYQLHIRVKESQCETLIPNVEFYCHCECGKESSATIFPNPNQGEFTIHFEPQETVGEATLVLYDINGRIQLQQDINVSAGLNSVSVHAVHLAKGMYKAVLRLDTHMELLTVEIQ
nr:T9SS type A sorting domain-containing protein [Chitinophagaceae bacterium]